MKKDIILAGVGGQGILSIASCIGIAAVEKNMYLKQAEVHGMSQRGGDVQSHLRLSDNEIASDLIPEKPCNLSLHVHLTLNFCESSDKFYNFAWIDRDFLKILNRLKNNIKNL